ncbi:MAG: hypothetical protein QM817_13455 [Archangium sp.]
MSTLDDKLKAWREATDVEPSPELLEKLRAQVETAPPSVLTPVKVFLSVMVVGVVALALLAPWRTQMTFEPARVVDGGVFAQRVCPPRPRLDDPPQAAILMPQDRRSLARDTEALMKRRPLTCEGQIALLRDLRWMRENTLEELTQLRTQQIFLCDDDPGVFVSERNDCDDSDWCQVPECDRRDAGCLELLAARPARTCAAQQARNELSDLHCRALIRGDESVRRRLQAGDWCLDDVVKKEVERLRAKGASPGVLPKR